MLLLARLAARRSCIRDISPSRVAVYLFHLLSCFPKDRNGGLITADDFGGAGELRKQYLMGRAVFELRPLDFTLSTDDLITHSMEDSSISGGRLNPGFSPRQLNPTDPFSWLPAEISEIILCSLPSVDVCRLRLASSAVAAISTPSCLTRRFWASRFDGNMEMGFFLGVIDAPPSRLLNINWHLLYTNLITRLARPARYPKLRNSRRLWAVLGRLCESLVPMLVVNHLDDAGNTPMLGSGCKRRGGPSIYSPTYNDQSRFNPIWAFTPLRKMENLVFPGFPSTHPIQINVSFIRFNCQTYISGIRVLKIHSSTAMDTSRAGLILPSNNTDDVWMDQGDELIGIQVSSAIDGIVGLSFHIRRWRSSTSLWRAVGNFDTSMSEVGISNLHPPHNSAISGLRLGLDVRHFLPSHVTPLTLPRPVNAFLCNCLQVTQRRSPPVLSPSRTSALSHRHRSWKPYGAPRHHLLTVTSNFPWSRNRIGRDSVSTWILEAHRANTSHCSTG